MKSLLIITIIILSYLTSCNRTSGNVPDKSKSQATPHFVIALFDTGTNGRPALRMDFIYRTIKDTVKYVSVDQSTQKKQLVKDTNYFISIKAVVLDNSGNKIKSINGADSIRADWFNVDKRRILIDGGRIDSVLLKYKQP